MYLMLMSLLPFKPPIKTQEFLTFKNWQIQKKGILLREYSVKIHNPITMELTILLPN
jgi:hypothetical protein